MKRLLIIMRHAQAGWPDGVSDHDRPLTARGHRDAPRVGALIASRGYTPQVVISSDANRTTETWYGLMEQLPGLEPRFTRSLYLSGLVPIRQVVEGCDDATTNLLLLGHNPGFSMTASWLTGTDIELQTAYAAVMSCEGSTWAATMKVGRWKLLEVLTPTSR